MDVHPRANIQGSLSQVGIPSPPLPTDQRLSPNACPLTARTLIKPAYLMMMMPTSKVGLVLHICMIVGPGARRARKLNIVIDEIGPAAGEGLLDRGGMDIPLNPAGKGGVAQVPACSPAQAN